MWRSIWRHSLWLEFMFQRLTLTRDFLSQDGAIFVSIDDSEIFHLGLLMNEARPNTPSARWIPKSRR